MSNDVTYNLTFSHSSKDYLDEVVKYLKNKKDNYDQAVQAGESTENMIKRLGMESPADFVSWGFEFSHIEGNNGYFYIDVYGWANENSTNIPIGDEDGELASLMKKFPELDIEGNYRDDFTYGKIYGFTKDMQGSVGDTDDPEKED
jgi:hypothetical protein